MITMFESGWFSPLTSENTFSMDVFKLARGRLKIRKRKNINSSKSTLVIKDLFVRVAVN